MKTHMTCPNCSPHSAVDCYIWFTLDPLGDKLDWQVECKKCKKSFTLEFNVKVFLEEEVWDKLQANRKPEKYNNKGERV